MKTKLFFIIAAGVISGLGMWIIAGLWHNLILPSVNENIHPHHEGIVIMLMAYLILGLLMSYVYSLLNREPSRLFNGLRLGIIAGILWVFPHGLAMAGVHNTSIAYEIQNAIWHIVEQGIGGIIIAFVHKN